jgi:hypothetical protein
MERMFEEDLDLFATSRTLPTAGMRIAARMPIIAITVRSSIRVNPERGFDLVFI